MPVIETPSTTRSQADDELERDLAAELRSPRPTGQPWVEIRNMDRNGLRHVYVTWDRWQGCEPENRAEVIRRAFRQVRGEEYERSIAVTVASTVPEAVEVGLLSLVVKPRRSWDLSDQPLARAREALAAEGGSELGRPFLPVLAFADERGAEEAAERLKARVPELDWWVVPVRPRSDWE